jgi:hypothetical protein
MPLAGASHGASPLGCPFSLLRQFDPAACQQPEYRPDLGDLLVGAAQRGGGQVLTQTPDQAERLHLSRYPGGPLARGLQGLDLDEYRTSFGAMPVSTLPVSTGSAAVPPALRGLKSMARDSLLA